MFQKLLGSRLLALAIAGALSHTGLAQEAAQPPVRIYPVYEGWLPNEDGTATLVFGYFNESPHPVVIAPGPDNGFSPPALDRGQPTTFRPGRQRNVCSMVVAPEQEAEVVWSIAWNGVPARTTEHAGRDPLYLLEEIGGAARAVRDLDTSAVPKGVCLNRPPIVRAGEDQTVGPLEARLTGFVYDEGLPRDGALAISWRLVSGPGTATIENPAAAQTRVVLSAPGSYELELSANDSAVSASDLVTIVVGSTSPP